MIAEYLEVSLRVPGKERIAYRVQHAIIRASDYPEERLGDDDDKRIRRRLLQLCEPLETQNGEKQ